MPERPDQNDPKSHEKPRNFLHSRAVRRGRRRLALGGLAACALAAISCAGPTRLAPAAGYELKLGQQHPLVGRVYAVATRESVSPSQLTAAIVAARYVVLGETHDNPDHHRLQAELLSSFLAKHPRAHVGFEMLDEDVAPALAGAPPQSPEDVAARVHWEQSGWPDFRLYRPIFAVALQHAAPLLAAHPSAVHVRASMQGLPEDAARSLKLDVPLPEAQIAAERGEIRDSHCGHANDAMLTAMQRAQQYKDAYMARALVQAGGDALLIAGRGHARNDRAVPFFLRRHGADRIVSVAFVDVSDGRVSAADYDVEAFDFVVFTPRVSDEDPCETFRKQLEQMQRHASGAQ
jgi:uncharacterized iron-regulated protein